MIHKAALAKQARNKKCRDSTQALFQRQVKRRLRCGLLQMEGFGLFFNPVMRQRFNSSGAQWSGESENGRTKWGGARHVKIFP